MRQSLARRSGFAARTGVGAAARFSLAAGLIVTLMRSVPLLFTLSLLLLGAVWLAGGRTTAGLVLIATAVGAMGFGLRISVASRLEARNRSMAASKHPGRACAYSRSPERR